MSNIFSSELISEIEVLIDSRERDLILQDISNILKDRVSHYDWVGFYTLTQDGSALELGPYAGKHTDHTTIPVGKGVCGQVAERNEEMVVQDVSTEANYLSCSIDVQSEIVVPIEKDGAFISQIDIDSRSLAPFTEADSIFLAKIAKLLEPLF